MARTVLANNIVKDSPTTTSVSVSSNSGMLIVDVNNETFTKKMRRELMGILFEFYVDVNGTKIRLDNRNILWTTYLEDRCLPIVDVPVSCYIKTIGIIDERYTPPEGETLDTTYPVKVYFDSAKIR